MAATKRLAHVVLQTTDLTRLKDWYLQVLDARVVYENGGSAFLTFDDEHHRLAILQIPGLTERTPITVGMAHSAYTFDTLADLMGKYRDLRDVGITPRVPVQHGVTTSLYYRDPDGNMVELQIDNFDTPEEATAYMEGQEYNLDFIGPSFDPDQMDEALAEGTPPEHLITRDWAKTTPQLNVVELILT
ncbi:VOC family protein [Mycolicibacterium komossense]|jgi:catechol-2,3-dioxygenase|uniref:VOC family protein n=1 Tax=Mycolicibacterium komossense TaxID=1779 RepID=A0ABT3CF61_9MYCO|nr:VOC family protein [Mycolicibacterium komossense]MCV7228041.1 VOC family protein [Mycolicibacterium komossense]